MVDSGLPWLQDVDRAAQHLTSLSLDTAALAAMILRAGELWAYAGELQKPVVEELVNLINQNWESGGGKDLVQFASLDSTGDDYLLYATNIADGMVLVMVFEAEMPFGKIRTQASRLARALESPPGSVSLDFSTPDKKHKRANILLEPLFPLDDVPPPTPSLAFERQNTGLEASSLGLPLQSSGEQVETTSIGEFESQDVDIMWETHPSSNRYETGEWRGDLPAQAGLVDTSQFKLSYAYLLVPRLPDHRLTGELATKMAADMRQLAVAFGWRLDYLAIRPDYLQWIANVPPNTSPNRLVRMIRDHTSKRIFARYAHLADDNPSGDFWAPGYLVMSTTQPLPAQTVNSFIENTRFNQGAAN